MRKQDRDRFKMNRSWSPSIRYRMILSKKLRDFFESGMLQLFENELFLFAPTCMGRPLKGSASWKKSTATLPRGFPWVGRFNGMARRSLLAEPIAKISVSGQKRERANG